MCKSTVRTPARPYAEKSQDVIFDGISTALSAPRFFCSAATRGAVGHHGTLAPTAAVASIPFAPEISIPAAPALRNFQGGRLYGKYGFFDGFNPSFRDTHVSLRPGSVDENLGWVDNDYLSDNQGPILGMIANYKTRIIWNATRKVPNLVRGLRRAGFTGGWLSEA
jgi:hypothetical protein